MCMGGNGGTFNINGKTDQQLGTQSPEDAAWIRANGKTTYNTGTAGIKVDASLGDAVLGWQSVAPPTQPDLADTTLKAAKQSQLLSGLASTGYMASFMTPPG